MSEDQQSYCVDGVEVLLVRDHRGARLECSQCQGECQHTLKAAAWMTLQSWSSEERSELH